jgi:TrmH family RNA methyltransferase
LGNEGNGISSKIEQLIANRLSIPSFNNNMHAESLNVATAAAIFLSEFRSRSLDY